MYCKTIIERRIVKLASNLDLNSLRTLILRYLVLSTLVILSCLHIGLVVWTLLRFSQIEQSSPGIQFFGNELIQTKGLTKSAVNNLQEGTWFHLVRVRKDGGITITKLDAGSPADQAGLQIGDVVVSINGVDLKAHPEAYFQERLRSRPGDPINLVWHRDGQMHSSSLTLTRVESAQYAIEVNQQELVMGVGAITWFQRGPFLIFPIVLLGFGTWMGFRSLRNPVAFQCALLFLVMALSSSILFHPMIAGWPVWVLSISIFVIETTTVLKAILIMQILSVFPNPTVYGSWLRRRAWYFLSLFIAWTIFRLTYLFGLTYGWDNQFVQYVTGILENVPDPTLPILVVLVAGSLLLAQRAIALRQQQMRLRVIETGFLLAFIIVPLWAITQPGTLLASSGLLPIQGPMLPVFVWFVDRIINIGFLCALPLSFAYAILAHRVFGLRFVFGKSLRYLVNNQGAFFILCFGIIIVLYETISVWPVGMLTSDLLVVCAVAGLTLVLLGGWTLAKTPVLRLMDRYLFSDEFESRQRLYKLECTLSSYKDRDVLVASIGRGLLEGLDLSYVAIYLDNPPHGSLSVSWCDVTKVPGQTSTKSKSHLVAASTSVEKMLQRNFTDQLLIEYGDSNTDGYLKESGFELIVVLRGESNRQGCIALGAKRSEEPYSSDEKERLLVLATEMELVLRNIEMAASLRHQAQGLRRLSHRLIDVQESERSRLSRDLHDDSGQALTALKISLELTRNELEEDIRHAKERLNDALTLTDETMEKLRTIAHGLRPPTLDTIGLNAALEGQCRSFAKRTRILLVYNGMEDIPDISSSVSICLYRILQEGLTNSAKHGKATRIEVNLEWKGQVIELSIVDNGKGFDPHFKMEDQNEVGIGLIDMRERLESLDGQLIVTSKPGTGTRLIASISLEDI